MKTFKIFEKQFANLKQAGIFLSYLGSHLKDVPEADFKLELKDNLIQITAFKDLPQLKSLIEVFLAEDKAVVQLFCDGGSRGNPGPGAAGYVLLEAEQVLTEGGKFFKYCTNNQAEYWSLKLGVEAALKMNVGVLDIYMDSQLIVKQIKGEYKIKNKDLMPIYQAIKIDLSKLQSYKITFIPRRHNRLADTLVNQILDQNL